jgi:hypothetical protein
MLANTRPLVHLGGLFSYVVDVVVEIDVPAL